MASDEIDDHLISADRCGEGAGFCMTRFWQNDKVYAKLGENLIAAIVLEVSPSAPGQADLVWLRIAVRNPYFADRWIISDYPEPVWSTELSVREVPPLIAGLDE